MTKGEKKIHSLPFLPSIYTYTHTRTISRSCDKAVPLVFPSCNSSTETPMGNTARRRRQAGRRRAVQTSTKAGVQSNPWPNARPHVSPEGFSRLSAIFSCAGLCGLQIESLCVCRLVVVFSQLFAFCLALGWAAAWLWGSRLLVLLLLTGVQIWGPVVDSGGLRQGKDGILRVIRRL
jgi:hypothetical protein